jgi:uncharacterized protein (DUF169 family)
MRAQQQHKGSTILYQEQTRRFIEYLQLQHLPVGLAFVEEVPTGIQHQETAVPSACTFWRLGEKGVFYATGDEHKECPIGMLTMGFAMPTEAQQRAGVLVETMASVEYFSPAEVSALPIVKKPHASIIYGRLDEFPVEADVILTVLNNQQAMLVAEASGSTNWLQGGQNAFGRPTCAVIPRTMQSGEISMSFGCIGARTYMGLSASELVLTIPVQKFAQLVERLQVIANANAALAPYHEGQKARFSA